MTSDTGAHIIGLFIRRSVSGRPSRELVDHIIQEGGLVYIPHPYKPDSGLLWCQAKDDCETVYVMEKASFIELYNGGWNSAAYEEHIRQLARKFGMGLVAGSDSHKMWQVGHYKNRLRVSRLPLDAAVVAEAAIEMYALQSTGAKAGGEWIRNSRGITYSVQANKVYQRYIRYVPFLVKRWIRKLAYYRQLMRYRRTSLPNHYVAIR